MNNGHNQQTNGQHKPIRLPKPAYEKLMDWIGSPASLFVHSLFFVGIFLLYFFHFHIEEILLILTTLVSLEAIYMAIFIQMAVNRTNKSLKDVEEDLEEIQEDVGEIQEDVGEIQEDVGELQEDVGEIQKDFDDVQEDVEVLEGHVQEMRENLDEEIPTPALPGKKNLNDLAVIQKQLRIVLDEIEKLKK